MIARTSAAIFVVATSRPCGSGTPCEGDTHGETTCNESNATFMGNLAADIVGTWEGAGIDSRIIWQFTPDGAWREVEPPNAYAPCGLTADGTYALEGERLVLSLGGVAYSEGRLEVDASTLTLTDSLASTFRRVTCRGYGFSEGPDGPRQADEASAH